MLTAVLFLVLTSGQSPPAAPVRDGSSAKAGTAAISGRITEHETGRPLPRTLVTLVASGNGRLFDTVADGDGRYQFTGLEPGGYALAAGPGEHRSTHLRHAFGKSEPLEFTTRFTTPNVDLKAGEVRSYANIVLMRTLGIEGRITSVGNEPMADVAVRVSHADGRSVWSTEVRSDDRGSFRLFGLAPGRYRVCALPGNQSEGSESDSARYVRTCHPASTAEASADDVVLTHA
jgi:protocatechuate 3,4-dioxygenase beta subunit